MVKAQKAACAPLLAAQQVRDDVRGRQQRRAAEQDVRRRPLAAHSRCRCALADRLARGAQLAQADAAHHKQDHLSHPTALGRRVLIPGAVDPGCCAT